MIDYKISYNFVKAEERERKFNCKGCRRRKPFNGPKLQIISTTTYNRSEYNIKKHKSTLVPDTYVAKTGYVCNEECANLFLLANT